MLASSLRLLASQSNNVLSTLMRLQSQCSRHGSSGGGGGGGNGNRDDTNHGVTPDVKLACQRDAMLLLDKKLRGSEPLTDMELSNVSSSSPLPPTPSSSKSSAQPAQQQMTAASVHAAMVDFSKLLRVGSFFDSTTETARIADALRFVAKHKGELSSTRQITFLCTPLLNLKDGSTGGARYVERELLPVLLRTLRNESTSSPSTDVILSEKELDFRRGALIAACQIASHLAGGALEAHTATSASKKKKRASHGNTPSQLEDIPHAVEIDQLVDLFCALCQSIEWLRRNNNGMLDVSECGAVLQMYQAVENLCVLQGTDSKRDTTHAAFSGACSAYVLDSLAVACTVSRSGTRRVADVNAVLMAAGQLKSPEEFRAFSQVGMQILPSTLSSGNVKDLTAAVQNLVRIRSRQNTMVPADAAIHFIEALRPRLFGAGGPGGFRHIHHAECSRMMSFLARLDVPVPRDVVDLLSAHFVNNVRFASVQQITPFVQGMARAATTARSSSHSSAAGAASAFDTTSFQTVLDKIVLRAQQCDAPALAVGDMASLLASLTALRYVHVTAFFESCEEKMRDDVTSVRESTPSSSLPRATVSTVLAALDVFSKEAPAVSSEEQKILQRAAQLRADLMAAIVQGNEVSDMSPRELVQLLDQMASSGPSTAVESGSATEPFQTSELSLEDSEKPDSLAEAGVDGVEAELLDAAARTNSSEVSQDAVHHHSNLKPVLSRVMDVSDSCTMHDAAMLSRVVGNLVHRKQLSKHASAPLLETLFRRVEDVAQEATARDVFTVLRSAFTAGQPIKSPAFWGRMGTLAAEEPVDRLQRWSYFARGILEKKASMDASYEAAAQESNAERTSTQVSEARLLLDAQIEAVQSIFARIPGALEEQRSTGNTASQAANTTSGSAESRFAQLASLSFSLSRLDTVCSARMKERAVLVADAALDVVADGGMEVEKVNPSGGEKQVEEEEEGDDDDGMDGADVDATAGNAAVFSGHNLLVEAAFSSIGDAVCATLHRGSSVAGDGASAEPFVAPKSVVILLTSFVDVRVQHPAMFYDILPLLKRLVQHLGPLEFSLVLHAYAALGVWNARLMSSLAVDMGAKLSESDVRQCASVLNGLQRSKLLKRSAIINGNQRELTAVNTGGDPILVLTTYTVQRMCFLVSSKSSVAELLSEPSAAQNLAYAATVLGYFDVPPQPALDTYIALTTKAVLAPLSSGAGVGDESAGWAAKCDGRAVAAAAALNVAPLMYKMSSVEKKNVAARAIAAFFQRILEADQSVQARSAKSDQSSLAGSSGPPVGDAILKPGQHCRILAVWQELGMFLEVPSLTNSPTTAAYGTRMACTSLSRISKVSNFAVRLHSLARLVGAPTDFIALEKQKEEGVSVVSTRAFLCAAVVTSSEGNQRVFESTSASDEYVKDWTRGVRSVRSTYCSKLDAVSLIESAALLYSASDTSPSYQKSYAQFCALILPTSVSVLFRNVQRRRATADERCVLFTGLALGIASDCCGQNHPAAVKELCEVAKGIHMNEKHISLRGATQLFLSLAVLRDTQIDKVPPPEFQEALVQLRSIAARALVSRIGCMDASADVLHDMYDLVTIGDGAILKWMREESDGEAENTAESAAPMELEERVHATLAKLKQESVRYGYPWFSKVYSHHVEALLSRE